MTIRKPSIYNIVIATTFVCGVAICCMIALSKYAESFKLYMLVLGISLFLITASDLVKKDRQSTILLCMGMLVMGTMMAFRAQTGRDDWNYEKIFNNANGVGLFEYVATSHNEIGYVLLNWFLHKLTAGNYDVAQAIITFISFLLWAYAMRFCRGVISYPVFALFIWTHYYFLIMSAALVRIFIAIPIVFIGLHYIWERKWNRYIICVLIASLFHMSALVMLVFLLISVNEKWFYKNWFIFIIILSVVIPVSFVVIAKLIVPMLGERYEAYGQIRGITLSLGSFDTLPIWMIGVYFMPKIPKDRKKTYVVAMILISMSIIFSVSSSVVSLGRLVYYANLGIPLLVSTISKNRSKNALDILIVIVMIAYGLFYMMHTGVFNDYYAVRLFPYYSIWENY